MSFRPTRFNSIATRPASQLGRPICALNTICHSLGTTTAGPTGSGGTVRIRYQTLATGISDVAFVFQNYANANVGSTLFGESVQGLANITYSNIYLEFNTASIPLFIFGGVSSTLRPGATLITDPYKVQIPPNTDFFLRYYFTVPANGITPSAQSFYFGSAASIWSNFGSPAGVDITSGTGITGLTAGAGPGALCIGPIGTPTATTPPPFVVGILGDSQLDNANGLTNGYINYAVQALASNGIPFVRGGMTGDSALNATLNSLTRARNILFGDCDAMIISYGGNDIAQGQTLAQIKTNLLAIWARYASFGHQVFAGTLPPNSTSTDSWTTAANQTPTASQPARLAVNTWLRAPITAGAGNSAMYDARGTLTGIIDAASYIETDALNTPPGGPSNPITGGRWDATGGIARTNDGVHPNAVGTTPMSASIPISSFGHRRIYPDNLT